MENRFRAILIENPYTVRYSNIIKPKSSNNYIVSEERQFVDVNFDNSYEVYVVDTEANINDTNPLLVLSTNPALGLPKPSKGFLEAFCADPDLIILNCTIFDYDNTCHIEYCSTQDKQETVKEIIEHNLRVPSEIDTRQEIIHKIATWRRNSSEPLAMLTISEMQWLADFLSDNL
jgi:hypothetical protein